MGYYFIGYVGKSKRYNICYPTYFTRIVELILHWGYRNQWDCFYRRGYWQQVVHIPIIVEKGNVDDDAENNW